tara:strand:+ start:1685 stop:2653 length:969 start_codon:yes stop_codon:yes gene_type:complete
MNVLVTGCAGFIGFHLTLKLLNKYNVFGVDNLNDYYDPTIKNDRLSKLKKEKNFRFYKLDISNLNSLKKIIYKNKIKYIVHLAAQAGVRYSIDHPEKYVSSNLVGFFNVLEVARIFKIKHMIFASTSSVYGNNKKFPLKEDYDTDKPLSFYAATKKSNEVMAHSYSNIYKLPCTGLRFFTVYGPMGRPDMSLYKFSNAIIKNKKIELYNKGNHYRDFTYVDDVVISISKLLTKPSKNQIPYDIFNIGSSKPYYLKKFLSLIEENLSKKAMVKFLKIQQGDVHKTHADVSKLKEKIKYSPKTDIRLGIKLFIDWYKAYYRLKK